MRVTILRLRSGECCLGCGQRVTAARGTPALRKQLPVLVLKRSDLRAEAAGIKQRRHAAACQCGAVARLEGGQLSFDIGDLALQLGRLILEKTDGKAGLAL